MCHKFPLIFCGIVSYRKCTIQGKERSVGVKKQEDFSFTMSVCYTMTEMLLIGHSERQLKADYLNEHNISSLTSDVYTTEHFLNVW